MTSDKDAVVGFVKRGKEAWCAAAERPTFTEVVTWMLTPLPPGVEAHPFPG